MALLRLPSTSPSSIQQQFFPPTPSRPSPQFISLSTFPQFISLSLNTQTPKFLPFCLSSTTQAEAPTAIDTDTPQEQQVVEEDVTSRTRLIAQNVPWSLTLDDVRPLFEKYGTIVDIELSLFSKTRNRGLAFVTMSSHEEAQTALDNLQSYEIEGRNLVLDWAKPRKEKPSPPQTEKLGSQNKEEPKSTQQRKAPPMFNLFVSNLPYQAKTKDLKDFFISENANVVSAIVIFKSPSGSAGYGFVSFKTQEEADAALETFQGKEFMGRPLRIEKSKSVIKPRRKSAIRSGDSAPVLKPKAEEPAKVEGDAILASNPPADEPTKVDDA